MHPVDESSGSGRTEAFYAELEEGDVLMALAAPADQTGQERARSRACIRNVKQEARRQKPGEFASPQEYLAELFSRAAKRLGAPKRVSSKAEAPRGPSCVLALFSKGKLYVGHLGNCRAYLCRQGKGTRLTFDHTVAQEAVDRTEISARELRTHPGYSVVTRWVGSPGDRGMPDLREAAVPLLQDDAVLLVNEGVHRLLDDGVLAQTVQGQDDPCGATQAVVGKANEVMASGSPRGVVVGLVVKQGLAEGAEPDESVDSVDVEELRTGEVTFAEDDEVDSETPAEDVAVPDVSPLVDTREPSSSPRQVVQNVPAPPDVVRRSRNFYGVAVLVLAVALALFAWWLFLPEDTPVVPTLPGQGDDPGDVTAKEGSGSIEVDSVPDVSEPAVEKEKVTQGSPDKVAAHPVVPAASAEVLQRCTRLLDEAVRQHPNPCALLGSYDKAPLFSACYQAEDRRARELWATRKNKLEEDCAGFRKKQKEKEKAELRARCLDGMEQVMKVPILKDLQCRQARIKKDSLEKECATGAAGATYEKLVKYISEGCRTFHEGRCRRALDRIEAKLGAASAGAWLGHRQPSACRDAKSLVKEAGDRDTGSCIAAELAYEAKVPNALLIEFEEATVKVREVCHDH